MGEHESRRERQMERGIEGGGEMGEEGKGREKRKPRQKLTILSHLHLDMSASEKDSILAVYARSLEEMKERIGDFEINEYELRFKGLSEQHKFNQLFQAARRKWGDYKHEVTLEVYLQVEKFNSHRLQIHGIDNIRAWSITGHAPPECMLHNVKTIPSGLLGWSDPMLTAYNIRMGAANENTYLAVHDDFYSQIMSSTAIKLYRYKSRYSFMTEKGHRLDMTVVKQASGTSASSSAYPNMPENYEVELEEVVSEDKDNPGYMPEGLIELLKMVNGGWLVVEDTGVIGSYRQLMFTPEDRKKSMGVAPDSSFFVLPDVMPMTIDKIALVGDTAPIDNIEYLVTDKADGTHHMLFITGDRLYLIDSNMVVKDTEMTTPVGDLNGTILDGELVGRTFLIFDCIINSGEDIRAHEFVPHRQNAMLRAAGLLHDLDPSKMQIEAKSYYPWSRRNPRAILHFYRENGEEAHQKYPLDGMIFLPAKESYPILRFGQRERWSNLLKYKPVKHQSIDFYTEFAKEEEAQLSLTGRKARDLTVMMTAKWGPQKGKVVMHKKVMLYSMSRGDYVLFKPQLYAPVESDPSSMFVPVDINGAIRTRDLDEVIYEKMVVECVWDDGWIPTRCRYEKSMRVDRGVVKAKPNDVSVAQSNWRQIQLPVRLEHLLSLEYVMRESLPYYENPELKPLSARLRGLHNLIKTDLIKGACKMARSVIKEGPFSLIDLGAGRAGDLHKWVKSRVERVVAVDVSESGFYGEGGLMERVEGGRGITIIPILADMSLPLDTGEAGINTKAKEELRNLYADIGLHAFHVATCNFALHYSCGSERSMRNILQNVSRNLRIGGVWVGAAFDGRMIWEALEEKDEERILIGKHKMRDGEVDLWRIKAAYPRGQPFMPFGQLIEVYNSWISQSSIAECLVNFDYLTKLAGEYGLFPVTRVESSTMFDFINTEKPGFSDVLQSLQNTTIPPAELHSYPLSGMDLVRELRGRPYSVVHPSEGLYSSYSRVFAYRKLHD